MKKVYVAGPLFDDHERDYLEKIADILESYSYDVFLPHRDAGLITGEFNMEKRVKVFDVDLEHLESADLVVALLTGRDVDSGTAAEVGYSFKSGKELVGIVANNVFPVNNFVWGLFEFNKNIVDDLDGLKEYLDLKN